jgi:signal transduction histidine kinase/phage shock protein PspC (stress-responsive transcriptional regulator)
MPAEVPTGHDGGVQEPSEPTWPPFRFRDRSGRRGWHSNPDLPVRLQELRNRGNGGPLRRDPDDRLGGGVAAGVAAWRGFSPTSVRIVFVVAAFLSTGWVVPVYFIGWLVIPERNDGTDAAGAEPASIGVRARHDSRGVVLAFALASLLAVFLLLAGVLNDGAIAVYAWPQVASVFCLTLIYRNAPEREQAALRRLVQPLEGLWATGGDGTSRRGTKLRFVASGVLLVAGLGWLLALRGGIALLEPLGGFLLVAAALVLLFGPWWLRIARDLVLERQARARAEERADIAARVHDSVLQTLALIQRRAEDPAAVVQLARAQERELRSWLFEGRAPGEVDVASLAEGVRQIQRDVEARHGVPVEVVTVGDCPLDEHVSALLAAAGEATVNAAKWSGAGVISVFAEVEPDKVAVAVRDRGKGFDLYAVPADRKGVAESIRGRMVRHGGKAVVQSAPGEGTKVTLTLPRAAKPGGQVPPNGGQRR